MENEFLGRFLLAPEEPVAIGGMSKVYRALDKQNGGFVAIKVLQLANNEAALVREAFSRELMALQDLGIHEAILRIGGIKALFPDFQQYP